jgi:hypothetical protein
MTSTMYYVSKIWGRIDQVLECSEEDRRDWRLFSIVVIVVGAQDCSWVGERSCRKRKV